MGDPADRRDTGPAGSDASGGGDAPAPEPAAPGADATDATDATDEVAGDAPHDDVIEVPDDLAELEELVEHDIEAVAAERDQFKDIALRLQADFDNYRRRAAAQANDEIDRATGRLAEAFLPVLDATEAAYLRHPDEVGPLLNVMLTELKKHGLESLDLEGEPFDPNLAEAVAHEAGDGGEVVVAEVLRSGYRWKGRTLRAAMVRTRD